MKHLILKCSDGTEKTIDVGMGIQPLFSFLKEYDVETIVVGETGEVGEVHWEKQFNSVTVMPSHH